MMERERREWLGTFRGSIRIRDIEEEGTLGFNKESTSEHDSNFLASARLSIHHPSFFPTSSDCLSGRPTDRPTATDNALHLKVTAAARARTKG